MSDTRVIAVDGPAGAGKSTTARSVARRLGWSYLDTGALYRCVALQALERGVALDDGDALAKIAAALDVRFGVGAGRAGTVIFLTLGTGVGSGVFVDGKLVPNTEFGQMEIRGRPAERRSASAARTRRGLSWKAWAQDLDEHLQRIEDLMWPTLFILGGGVSKNADKFVPRLTNRTPVVAAGLRNDAGIIGAAVVAVEGLRDAATTWDDLPGDLRPTAT